MIFLLEQNYNEINKMKEDLQQIIINKVLINNCKSKYNIKLICII